MKKYNHISIDNHKDELYKLIENYNLTDEEKIEVDNIINNYASILQKINKKIEKKEFENLKNFIVYTLKQERNV